MANLTLTTEDKLKIIHLTLQGITIDRIALSIKRKSNTVKKFIIKNKIRELESIKCKNKLYFIAFALSNNIDRDIAEQLYTIKSNKE
ncbi:hypothetical protein [Vibrio harveyi]|uniref:hypothetical protein n=1 Tax=Vibrio harveyi TaxID=669 RepID=UPI000755DE20|nr:hypothetical protein [Vibrio harveyi]PNM43658.1 hypothetical protein AL469_027805 [Vibrio harveyi]